MMTFNRKLNGEAKSSFFSREKPVFWLFFTLYLLLGLSFVFLGKFWADEGWYFGGSWLVANGQLPYLDFFTHHNPVLFYVYGIPQYLFGPNIIVGRLTSLLIMLLTFVLVWRLSRKLGGKTAVLISSGLLITNLFVIYYFTTFSYRVLEACLMLLFFTILLGNLRDSIKYPLATLPLCLMVGIRYPIDIVSGLLVLYLVYIAYRSWQNKRVILLSLFVTVLSLAAIMLPFIVLARDQFFFGTITFSLMAPAFWVESGIIEQPSILHRLYHVLLVQFRVFQIFYATATVLFGLLFYVISRAARRKTGIKELIAKNQSMFSLIVFVILCEIVWVIPFHSSVGLRTLTFPVAVIVAGVGLARILGDVKDRSAIILLYGLIIGMIIFTPFAQFAQGNEARSALAWKNAEINYVLEVANKVEDYTDKGDKVLTFTPMLALQADRELLPGTLMELYSFFPTWETERCKKYNLLNVDMLLDYLSSKEAGAVVLTEGRFFSGRWMSRSLDEYRPEILRVLNDNYYLAEKLTYPLSDTWRGDVYIYLPKSE